MPQKTIEELTALVSQQQKLIELQQNQIIDLQKKVKQLEKENKKLHAQLAKFVNEYTPSGSVPSYLKDELKSAFPPENSNTEKTDKETKQAKLSNKRNKRPKPDKKKKHKIKNCPCCGKKLKPLDKKHNRIIIHLEMPKPLVISHESESGYCNDCKKRFYAPAPDSLPNLKFSKLFNLFIRILNSYTIPTKSRTFIR